MNLKPLYKVELIDQEGEHFYSIDGSETYFPGATGPLDCLSKPALVPWASKITAEYFSKMMQIFLHPNSVFDDERRFDGAFWKLFVKRAKKQPRFTKEKAARFGTSVHKLLDILIKDPTSTFNLKNQEMKTVVESCALWIRKEKLKIIQGDTAVASRKYCFGGSVDCFGLDESGKLWIIDFKTSKSLYQSHAYQVGGAYAQATKETYGLDYTPKAVLVRFGKERIEFERVEVDTTDLALRGFLAGFEAYNIQKINLFTNRILEKLEKKEKTNVRT